MKQYIALFLFAILTFTSFAQELTVRAPGRVEVGQRFEVRFEINSRASDFRGPTFKGLSVLTGPNTSQQSSTHIYNGQITREFIQGFTYIVQADVEGTFNIGGASCTVEGKKISCPGFTIKVEKASPQSQQRQQAYGGSGYSQQRQSASQPAQSGNIDSRQLFARASLSKSNPYQGEQVILTYKIYTQVSLQQYQIDKLPGNKGFWSEDLTKDGDVRQYEETVDGRRYMVAEIRRGALFAQESGKLTIEPLNLDVLALVQRQRRSTGSIWDLFDDPFFNPTQAVTKHLSTNSLAVNVKPLPESPNGFCGAVGNFTVKGEADTREVKANEAITYRLTISGSGNLMLIDAPQINFPKVFEVYDPQVNDHISHSTSGVSGSRTYEWVLIPRSQGNFEIPAVDFVFFDPKTGKYVTKHIDAIPVHILKGDPNAMKHVSSNKSDVKMLNTDINYIHSRSSRLLATDDANSISFWLVIPLLIIVLGFVAAEYLLRRREAQQKDVAGMRLRRATKEARRRLKQAAIHLNTGNDNMFYEEIYKAIWGCLADKYNIPLSDLSSDTVLQCLTDKQVPQEQQDRIMRTIHDVDFARFAPGDAAAKKQQIYDEALETIVMI